MILVDTTRIYGAYHENSSWRSRRSILDSGRSSIWARWSRSRWWKQSWDSVPRGRCRLRSDAASEPCIRRWCCSPRSSSPATKPPSLQQQTTSHLSPRWWLAAVWYAAMMQGTLIPSTAARLRPEDWCAADNNTRTRFFHLFIRAIFFMGRFIFSYRWQGDARFLLTS